MFASLKFKAAVFGLACIAVAPLVGSASAVTVEVAKKCDALTAKAFPPRELGNPAAGSAKGSGAAQQAYYKKCVAKRGKVPSR